MKSIQDSEPINNKFIKDLLLLHNNSQGDTDKQKEVDRIISNLVKKEFKSDVSICTFGEQGETMYFVESGSLSVYDKNGDKINEIKEEGYFGEYAVISDQPRSATVKTDTDTTLYEMHKDDVMRLIAINPSTFSILLKRLYSQIGMQNIKLTELTKGRQTTTSQIENPKLTKQQLFINYSFVAIVFAITAFITPIHKTDLGVMIFIPPIFLMVYIAYTKRIFEAITLGTCLGFLMSYKSSFFIEFGKAITNVLMEENTAWLIVVCTLMSSIVVLIEKAGGAQAFGEFAMRKMKSKKSVQIGIWLACVFMFIDEYLCTLTVGSSMLGVTDRYRISREQFSYIISSTGVTLCSLVPVSAWGVFIGGVIASQKIPGMEDGALWFIKSIPFSFYQIFMIIISFLVVIGVFPLIGQLKTAEKRIAENGATAPQGSDKFSFSEASQEQIISNPKLYNFYLPILFLIISSLVFGYITNGSFGVEMKLGILSTLVFMFILYIPQRIMTPEDFAESIVSGIKNMLFPVLLIVMSFLLAESLNSIGFMDFVIKVAAENLVNQAWLLPFAVFIVFAAVGLITSFSWALYVVAIPVVIPLALMVHVNPAICIGAVMSAGVIGTNLCMFSGDNFLCSAATGCEIYSQYRSKIAYGSIAVGLSAISYLFVRLFLYI